MARRYDRDELLELRNSPLCVRPENLPPLEEWMGPPPSTRHNPKDLERPGPSGASSPALGAASAGALTSAPGAGMGSGAGIVPGARSTDNERRRAASFLDSNSLISSGPGGGNSVGGTDGARLKRNSSSASGPPKTSFASASRTSRKCSTTPQSVQPSSHEPYDDPLRSGAQMGRQSSDRLNYRDKTTDKETSYDRRAEAKQSTIGSGSGSATAVGRATRSTRDEPDNWATVRARRGPLGPDDAIGTPGGIGGSVIPATDRRPKERWENRDRETREQQELTHDRTRDKDHGRYQGRLDHARSKGKNDSWFRDTTNNPTADAAEMSADAEEDKTSLRNRDWRRGAAGNTSITGGLSLVERDWIRPAAREQEPEWLDSSVDKEPSRGVHTQEDFQRWKERMKASSSAANPPGTAIPVTATPGTTTTTTTTTTSFLTAAAVDDVSKNDMPECPPDETQVIETSKSQEQLSTQSQSRIDIKQREGERIDTIEHTPSTDLNMDQFFSRWAQTEAKGSDKSLSIMESKPLKYSRFANIFNVPSASESSVPSSVPANTTASGSYSEAQSTSQPAASAATSSATNADQVGFQRILQMLGRNQPDQQSAAANPTPLPALPPKSDLSRALPTHPEMQNRTKTAPESGLSLPHLPGPAPELYNPVGMSTPLPPQRIEKIAVQQGNSPLPLPEAEMLMRFMQQTKISTSNAPQTQPVFHPQAPPPNHPSSMINMPNVPPQFQNVPKGKIGALMDDPAIATIREQQSMPSLRRRDTGGRGAAPPLAFFENTSFSVPHSTNQPPNNPVAIQRLLHQLQPQNQAQPQPPQQGAALAPPGQGSQGRQSMGLQRPPGFEGVQPHPPAAWPGNQPVHPQSGASHGSYMLPPPGLPQPPPSAARTLNPNYPGPPPPIMPMHSNNPPPAPPPGERGFRGSGPPIGNYIPPPGMMQPNFMPPIGGPPPPMFPHHMPHGNEAMMPPPPHHQHQHQHPPQGHSIPPPPGAPHGPPHGPPPQHHPHGSQQPLHPPRLPSHPQQSGGPSQSIQGGAPQVQQLPAQGTQAGPPPAQRPLMGPNIGQGQGSVADGLGPYR